jgi:hypothetical protein
MLVTTLVLILTIYDWIQRSSIEGDTYQLQKYVYIHQEETKVTLKALLY